MKLAAVKVPVSTVWESPDSPRPIDALAVAAVPDVAAWAASMDADSRLGLHGRTLTQLLLAEPVMVRSERDGWSEIVAPWQPSSKDELGYPGWVPSSHLGELPASASTPVAVSVPIAALTAEPGRGSVTDVSFGTVLASTDRTDGYTRVALPDGAQAWLANDTLRPVGPPAGRADRVRLGSQFVGLAYLWGGTSAYGFDCSGLVHAVSRVLGQRIPRDAHDQCEALERLPVDAVEPGDLYFFARPGKGVHHVGFVSAEGMLHASETGKLLENQSELSPERLETLVAAARL